MSDPSAELDQLIANYLAAEDAGAAPDPVTYLDAHPRFRRALAAFFAAHLGLTDLLYQTPPPTADPSIVPVGTVFAGYTIRAVAGMGGTAVVYRAWQPDPAREVALKVLTPDPHRAAAAVIRFRREAATLARLEHPQIARVYEAGTFGGRPFLAMEWLPGGTLDARRRQYQADPRSAARVVRDLTAGLAAAHALGIIHRDLKPANVLFDATGRPKLVDFGMAADADRPVKLTRTGEAVGTAEYMAPEQASPRFGPTTEATDVHGLGAVLYTLLAARPPFAGDTLVDVLPAVVGAVPTDVRRLNPAVPRDLAAVCHRCLEKQPARRYQSAAELVADLDRFLAGRPTLARRPGLARRLTRWAERRPAVAAVVAGLVVVAVGLAVAVREVASGRAAVDRAAADATHARVGELLARARARRLDPAAGWTRETLADLKTTAGLALAPADQVAVRSELANALGGLDLVRRPDLAVGWNRYAVAAHPTEPRMVVSDYHTEPGAEFHLQVIDTDTGAVVRKLTAPTDASWQASSGKPDQVRALAVSPDGAWLAGGTRGGRVLVWAWAGGPAPVTDRPVLPNPVAQVAFSAGGRVLFARAWDQVVGLARDRSWEPAAPSVPSQLALPDRVGGFDEAVADPVAAYLRLARSDTGTGLIVTPDGTGRVSNVGFHTLTVLDLASGMECGRIELVDEPPLGRSDFGRWVIPAAGRLMVRPQESDRRLEVWRLNEFRPVLRSVPLTGGSCVAALDPAGRRLYVAEDRRVAAFDVTGADVQDEVGWTPAPVVEADLDPAGDRLAVNTALGKNGFRAASHPLRAGGPPAVAPVAVTQTPSSRRVYGFADGLGCWPDPGGKVFGRLRVADGRFDQFAVDAASHEDSGVGVDGELWVSVGHEVRRFAPPDFRPAAVWRNPAEFRAAGLTVQKLAPGPAGCLLGRRDGTLVAVGPDAAERGVVRLFGAPITALAQSRDGLRVVAGSLNGEVVTVEPRTQIVRGRVANAHTAAVTAGAVASTGLVATGSGDRTVRLWTPDAEPLLTLHFPAAVKGVWLPGDGRTLYVLVNGERAVRRWHLDRLADGLRAWGADPGF